MLYKAGNAAIVGTIAASAYWIAATAGMTIWLVFFAWASYFVFAHHWKAGVWAFLHIVVGLVMGVGLVKLIAAFGPAAGILVPVGVTFFFAAGLTILENFPPMNNMPAYYFGVVAMFASGRAPELTQSVQLAIPIAFGFAFGWLTTTLIAAYSRLAPGLPDAPT